MTAAARALARAAAATVGFHSLFPQSSGLPCRSQATPKTGFPGGGAPVGAVRLHQVCIQNIRLDRTSRTSSGNPYACL